VLTSSWSGRSWPTLAYPSTTNPHPTYENLNKQPVSQTLSGGS
jgi:hypothetical protein